MPPKQNLFYAGAERMDLVALAAGELVRAEHYYSFSGKTSGSNPRVRFDRKFSARLLCHGSMCEQKTEMSAAVAATATILLTDAG